MASFKDRYLNARKRTGEALQAVLFHKILIALVGGREARTIMSPNAVRYQQVFLDATLVIVDLGYMIIHPDCHRPGQRSEQPEWLEVLSHISLGITALFLVEIPLTLWSLGFRWYNPWGGIAHSWLHLFDATVIVATFVLEVVLRGQDSEFAALLIILRLWRIVKLVAGKSGS